MFLVAQRDAAAVLELLTLPGLRPHPVDERAVRAVIVVQPGRVTHYTQQRVLAQHSEPPYPPLRIGKCLYCPELVLILAA